MDLNFQAILNSSLNPEEVFRLANQSPAPEAYLLQRFLPERTSWSYQVSATNMTVKAIMAGLTGMDSPYPKGGMVSVSRFLEDSAKIANDVRLSEKALRELQAMASHLMASGESTNERLANEMLNFVEKVILQAHWDTMEFLRGQALTTGALDWQYNKLNLSVDYGIPSANKLTKRTGNDTWDGTTSKFWTDIRLLQKRLKYNVTAYICSTDTLQAVLANDVNKVEVRSQEGNQFALTRLVGDVDRQSTDRRDSVNIITYDREGEIINPSDPEESVKIPFIGSGLIVAIGAAEQSGYRVGEGSTDDPENSLPVGYTHLAPTTEGGGRPGRYARLYVPENEPYTFAGQGVTNGLPVIEVPKKIAIASSDLS